jgi:hypothetical protein
LAKPRQRAAFARFVYWLHPVDYDAAVLMFKKLSPISPTDGGT